MIAKSLVAAGLVLAAHTGEAAPKITPAAVRADIDRHGPKAVTEAMWNADTWNQVERGIGNGDAAWIALAPRLVSRTDAGASEGLGISLAYALPKNPAAVLSVLDQRDGPVLGVSRVCSIPFIEVSDAFVRRYRARALAAVEGVKAAPLAEIRRACLTRLRRS